jgi:hypothetical protein
MKNFRSVNPKNLGFSSGRLRSSKTEKPEKPIENQKMTRPTSW